MLQKIVPDIIGEKQTIATLTPKATVREAVRRFVDDNVGAVMVVEGSRLVGIFTERDVMKRVLAADLDLDKTTLDGVMTKNPDTLPPGATINDVVSLMVKHGHRHVPVLEGQRIVGMVSSRDVIGNMVKSIRHGVSNITRELLKLG